MKRKFLVVACIFAAISLVSCRAEQTVDVLDAASYISSLTKDTSVVVTGKFSTMTDVNHSLLDMMARAITVCGYKVDLDLSNTTGLSNMSRAFDGCTGLTSIVIPVSVTYIDNLTFRNCTGLEKITVSEGNKVYDSRDNCNAIIETSSNTLISGCKNTAIPDSVTKIKYAAFDGCTELASIIIPEGVTEIGESAFYGCAGLERITVSAGNKVYDSRDNCNAIIETSSNTLISGCKNTAIPDSVTKVGDNAFDGCTELASIIIPEGVTEIGEYAFYGCAGLERISVSAGNKVYDSRNNCNAIIETSSNTLISGCKNTAIPDSVTKIDGNAFRKNTGLTSISIPKGVTDIGRNAFDDCTALERITVSEENKVYDSRNNCNAIIETSSNTLISGCKNTTIPNSVTKIGKGAFYNCAGLKSVTIPKNVTEIGDSAFSFCTELTNISIPSSVTKIGRMAFYNCTGLKSVTIPKSVTEIGDFAFSCCINLTNITILGNVTTMGSGAFIQCFNLKNIEFSEGITQIGPRAFCGCTNLKSITIPDSVTEIGEKAFMCCTNIKNLIISDNVSTIGFCAFFYCKNLQSITISGNTEIDWNAFSGCLNLKEVTVPVSSFYRAVIACESGERTEDFPTGRNIKVVVTGEFEYDSLEEFRHALISLRNGEYNRNLRSTFIDLDLSNTTELDEITDKAFFGCSNLVGIVIPDSVTEIGNNAFNGSGLETAIIPNTVDEIGAGAFYKCKNLSKVTTYETKDGLQPVSMDISNDAFRDCESLESIEIPDNVRSIGSRAFSNAGLKSVVFKDPKNWLDSQQEPVDVSNPSKAAEYLVQEECPYLYKDITRSASANNSTKSSSKSSGGKNVVIKSSDGKTKVNFIGTWTSNGKNGIKYTLKINSDGTFFYSAYTNSYSGPKQLSHKPDGTMSTSIGYESKGNWRIIDGNILHREYTSSWATDSDILSEVAPRKGEVTDREIRVLGEDQIFFSDAIWTKQ